MRLTQAKFAEVNATAFQVAGADYDALGQWTDDTIKGLILARFGLELA